ncbi:MAG: hypothetical protein OEX22_05180 [Cyclobacteriaceae bacterium]|nr:hypothetical protein [Cyclobacteriaceae bacterium]
MKTHFLFPNKIKPLGWILFFPSLLLGTTNLYFDFEFDFLDLVVSSDTLFKFGPQNLTDEFALVGVLVSLMMIGFSKLKTEDEYVQKIRLDSLLWAMYLNITLVILSTLFLYGGYYFSVLIYNLFTLPLFFVIRFHYYLSKR